MSEARDPEVLKRILVLAAIRAHQSGGGDYKLGAGDVIRITVFDLPEMNRTVKILESGGVSLPLLGTVKAAGLTGEGFRASLEGLLGKKYLVNPQVDVFVETYGSQRVAVIGRVEKPGTYPLSQTNNRMLDLIGQAGGLLREAARRVEFFPVEENPAGGPSVVAAAVAAALAADAKGRPQGQQPIVVNLLDLMNLADPISSLPLRDGDVLYIPDQGEFFVGGEVRKPGKFTLSERSSVMTAIAEAGGLGEYPIPDEVMLVRQAASGEKVMYEIDYEEIVGGRSPDITLQPNDSVIVPRSRLKATFFTIIDTMGRFIGIGLSAPL